MLVSENLGLVLVIPQAAAIGPVAVEALSSVRVSDLNETSAVAKGSTADQRVGVVHDEAISVAVAISVGRAGRTRVNDVTWVLDVLEEGGPKGFSVHIGRVVDNVVRHTSEGANSDASITTNDMLVVSMILGESLLEDGSPETTISRDAGKESGKLAGTWLVEREPVVNDNGGGNTEGVHVDTIDTSRVKLAHVVQEGLFETAWDLSH